jgi:phosphohistidine phosphatase
MKRLTLMRHAKSSWDDPTIADFERPLNRRGERDAPAMGRRLRDAGARPSLIVSSPAARALATARQVADALGYPREFLQTDHSLYLASSERLREVIALQDDTFRDLMIVGHNPGLTEFAAELSDQPVGHLATGAVVVIDLPIDSWQALTNTACGHCVLHDFPRNLVRPAPDTLQRIGE